MNLFSKSINPELKKRLFKLERTAFIPELVDLSDTPISYTILGTLIKVNITKDYYSIEEPKLNENEKQTFQIIKTALFEIINVELNNNIEEYLEKSIKIIISELNLKLTEELMKKIIYYSYRDFLGFGKIEAFLRDPLIKNIAYKTPNLTIEHIKYGILKTDRLLNEEEISFILRKLALTASTELNPLEPELEFKNKVFSFKYRYIPEKIIESNFIITKAFATNLTPNDLIKKRYLSPEILAFLWMLIEDHKNIYFINGEHFLYSLSYFLPPHSKVLTNIENYIPNTYTNTILFGITSNEDYAILRNYQKQILNGTIIASTDSINEINNTICYVNNNIITSIKENGKELFAYKENKFYFNMENSDYIISRGNKAILNEEFKLKTRLISVLIKSNLSEENFKKTLSIYYENPVAVLKKAGVL